MLFFLPFFFHKYLEAFCVIRATTIFSLENCDAEWSAKIKVRRERYITDRGCDNGGWYFASCKALANYTHLLILFVLVTRECESLIWILSGGGRYEWKKVFEIGLICTKNRVRLVQYGGYIAGVGIDFRLEHLLFE